MLFAVYSREILQRKPSPPFEGGGLKQFSRATIISDLRCRKRLKILTGKGDDGSHYRTNYWQGCCRLV